VRGSGSVPGQKGDVSQDSWLVELKFTARKSYALKRALLQKIEWEAVSVGRRPAFWIEYRDDPASSGEQYVVLPRWVADELGIAIEP